MINHKLFTVVLVSVMAISSVGCAKSGGGQPSKPGETSGQTTIGETTSETEATSSETEPEQPANLYVTINGTDIRKGMKLADVEKSLGAPKKKGAMQTCQGGPAYPYAQYEGIELSATPDGKINSIVVDSEYGDTSAIVLGGKIKTGDPFANVKEIFGEPAEESERGEYKYYDYRFDNAILTVGATNKQVAFFIII